MTDTDGFFKTNIGGERAKKVRKASEAVEPERTEKTEKKGPKAKKSKATADVDPLQRMMDMELPMSTDEMFADGGFRS